MNLPKPQIILQGQRWGVGSDIWVVDGRTVGSRYGVTNESSGFQGDVPYSWFGDPMVNYRGDVAPGSATAPAPTGIQAWLPVGTALPAPFVPVPFPWTIKFDMDQPEPAKTKRKRISSNGRDWVWYDKLNDPEPFELYKFHEEI